MHTNNPKAMANFEIGQEVKDTNGNPSIHRGNIVKIIGRQLVIIGDEAGMQLWNAGYAVGDCIDVSQIIPENM